jgi:hypothetical protein
MLIRDGAIRKVQGRASYPVLRGISATKAFNAAEKNGRAEALQNERAHLIGLNPSGRLSDRNPGDPSEGGGEELGYKVCLIGGLCPAHQSRATQRRLLSQYQLPTPL